MGRRRRFCKYRGRAERMFVKRAWKGGGKRKKEKKKLPAKLKLLLSYIALGYAQRSTLDGLITGKNNGIKVFFSSVCPRPPRGCAAPSPPAHGERWPRGLGTHPARSPRVTGPLRSGLHAWELEVPWALHEGDPIKFMLSAG